MIPVFTQTDAITFGERNYAHCSQPPTTTMIPRLVIHTSVSHKWPSSRLSNPTAFALPGSRVNSYRCSKIHTEHTGGGTQSSNVAHARKFAIATLLTLGVAGYYALQRGAFPDHSLLRTGTTNVLPTQHSPSSGTKMDVDTQKAALQSDSNLNAALSGFLESNVTLAATYGTPDDVQKAIEELRLAFPDRNRVSTDPNVLKLHGSSENSYHPSSAHSVVVQARSTEDVVNIVNISRKYRIPIIPYSGATSLEGHFGGVGLMQYLSLKYLI